MLIYLNSGDLNVKYRTDFVICVESQAVGERIKEDVERFLKTLKLPINQDKSGVVKNQPVEFSRFYLPK